MPTLAVDTRQAAQMLSLSQSTVKRLTRSGRLRVVRAGRRVTIPISALKEFLEVPANPGPTEFQEGKGKGES